MCVCDKKHSVVAVTFGWMRAGCSNNNNKQVTVVNFVPFQSTKLILTKSSSLSPSARPFISTRSRQGPTRAGWFVYYDIVCDNTGTMLLFSSFF